MRSVNFKTAMLKSALAASVLLLSGGAALGQQQINLTAGPATATLPDGSAVPMWGYTCGTAATGSTATCTALNKAVAAAAAAGTPLTGVWSPVVITIPYTTDPGTGANTTALTINLTNNLAFPVPPATPVNFIPTSLTIVGQLGGGLGTGATSTPSPDHTNAQAVTWPIAGTPP